VKDGLFQTEKTVMGIATGQRREIVTNTMGIGEKKEERKRNQLAKPVQEREDKKYKQTNDVLNQACDRGQRERRERKE
jgi:hypothetical protein